MVTGAMCRAFHAVVPAFSSGIVIDSFKNTIENKLTKKADEDSQIKIHGSTSFRPSPSPGVASRSLGDGLRIER